MMRDLMTAPTLAGVDSKFCISRVQLDDEDKVCHIWDEVYDAEGSWPGGRIVGYCAIEMVGPI